MTGLEIASVAVQFVCAIFIGFTVLHTARQLKLLRETHSDNHDWNRRKAAQDACERFIELVPAAKSINEVFDYVGRQDPISLDEAEKAFREDKNLRGGVHQLLNFYEMLSRGIKQGVYDEEVVKQACRTNTIQAYRKFGPYIDSYRKKISPRLWKDLGHIATRWMQEDAASPSRVPTGTLE